MDDLIKLEKRRNFRPVPNLKKTIVLTDIYKEDYPHPVYKGTKAGRNSLSSKDFCKIIDTFFNILFSEYLLKGLVFKMPYGIGELLLTRVYRRSLVFFERDNMMHSVQWRRGISLRYRRLFSLKRGKKYYNLISKMNNDFLHNINNPR